MQQTIVRDQGVQDLVEIIARLIAKEARHGIGVQCVLPRQSLTLYSSADAE